MAADVDRTLPESEICEWKWSWRDDYMKWMSAFAYTDGGTLHIGVNDDGYVVGLKDYRRLLEDLPNKFRDKLHITPLVRLRHVDGVGVNIRYSEVPDDIAKKPINRYACGRYVPENDREKAQLERWEKENPVSVDDDGRLYYIEIEVDHYTVLVTYNGIQYTRSGSTLQVLGGADLEQAALRLSDTRQDNFYVNRVFPVFSISDLRQDLIDKARKLAIIKKADHPWKGMDNAELLRSCGLILIDTATGKEALTLAAILLFGTDIMIKSVCFQYKTDAIVRIIDTDRYDDREVVNTNLIESYEKLMAFGERHLNDRFVLDEYTGENGAKIVQNVSARDKILREVVGNILMHRDFSSGHVARMVIGKDKIELVNANRPHGHGDLDPTTFRPFQKNPAISQVFREMGLADELGSGMRNSYKYTKLYSGATPTFTEEGDLFRITIPLSEAATVSAGPTENGGDNARTEDIVKEIITFCDEPRTIKEMMEHLGLKSRDYFRRTVLMPLLESGDIEMTIPEKPRSSKQKYVRKST